MATFCPLCARGEPHDTCQEVNRPVRFRWIKVTGGVDGQILTTIEMYPAGVS